MEDKKFEVRWIPSGSDSISSLTFHSLYEVVGALTVIADVDSALVDVKVRY